MCQKNYDEWLNEILYVTKKKTDLLLIFFSHSKGFLYDVSGKHVLFKKKKIAGTKKSEPPPSKKKMNLGHVYLFFFSCCVKKALFRLEPWISSRH